MSLPALAVDVRGLAKLVERRGKSFAVLELIQNAWDEDVTKVEVALTYTGYNKATLMVEDDSPEGFRDLSHAFTLYADSYKKADPEKRGRFNLGEKLVIALSHQVEILTTKGGVHIDVAKNQRRALRQKRERGTRFWAVLRMTEAEVAEAVGACFQLLPPAHCSTWVNGVPLEPRTPVRTFEATLATEQADAEGYLRPTKRKTTVEVHEVRPHEGERAWLYELGLPVVPTDDTWHINVTQKVPLNSDRDNVTPAYLRDLRALVLNAMAADLPAASAGANWVNEALEDELVDGAAVEQVMTKRFGERRVIQDPNDQEANRSAMAQGYTVIPGRALSGAAWANVRRFEAATSAGRVFPSPTPFSADGTPLKVIDPESFTEEQRRFAKGIEHLHRALINRPIRVVLASDASWGFAGAYGDGKVIINVATLVPRLDSVTTLKTLLHEFGHAFGDHLTHAFDDGIALVAARLALLVLKDPDFFNPYLED